MLPRIPSVGMGFTQQCCEPRKEASRPSARVVGSCFSAMSWLDRIA